MEQEYKVLISADQAIGTLPDKEEIHTFRNPRVGVLFGCDWLKEYCIEKLHAASHIELTGPSARKMNHGIAIPDEDGMVFIETVEAELKKLEEVYESSKRDQENQAALQD